MTDGWRIDGVSGGVDRDKLKVFALAPAEPIQRELNRRSTNVQRYQVRRCPRRTGKLVSTSRKNRIMNSVRPGVDVTIGKQAETPYLGYILYGTSAHEIQAKPDRPNPHLRFMGSGGVVFARRVWHPGTAPNPFVQESMKEAAK